MYVTGADECPLHLDPLLPLTIARVRKDKHIREPAPAAANASPEASFNSGIAHRRPWNTECQDKKGGNKTVPGRNVFLVSTLE